MTNAALQTMIDTFGDRIAVIYLDNDHHILLGYENRPLVADIKMETIGGTDVFSIPETGKTTRPIIKYRNYYPTETIQYLSVMDEEFANYRPDPLTFR